MNQRLLKIALLAYACACGVVNAQDMKINPEAYVDQEGLWKGGIVPICWENPENYAQETAWVEESAILHIEGLNREVSNVRFVGKDNQRRPWGKCTDASNGIRITIADQWPNSQVGQQWMRDATGAKIIYGNGAPMQVPTRTITPDSGLIGTFVASHQAAYKDLTNAQKAKAYLDDGFAMVHGNCKEFFKSAGESQKWIGVSRDAIVTVGTIGSAVLALHNGSQMAAGNLALFTGLSNAGLDIYTKNFLFAAENISSVETLVLNAVGTHRSGVYALEDPLTYQTATGHILDNQSYCLNPKIAELARDAIKNGKLEAATTSSGLTQVVEAADATVLRRIGTHFGLPGPVTADHAGAIWWLLNEFNTIDERKYGIAPKLANLPTPPIDQNGVVQTGWPAAAVQSDLYRFSTSTVAQFKKGIEEARPLAAQAAGAANTPVSPPPAAPGAAAAPPAPGGMAAAAPFMRQIPRFEVPVPAGRANQGGSVTVKVR